MNNTDATHLASRVLALCEASGKGVVHFDTRPGAYGTWDKGQHTLTVRWTDGEPACGIDISHQTLNGVVLSEVSFRGSYSALRTSVFATVRVLILEASKK